MRRGIGVMVVAALALAMTRAGASRAQELPHLRNLAVGVWQLGDGGGYVVVGVEGHRWLLEHLRLERSRAAAACEDGARASCAGQVASSERGRGRAGHRLRGLPVGVPGADRAPGGEARRRP